MRKIAYLIGLLVLSVAFAGCAKENKKKDRSDANDMFRRITALASSFTYKMEQAPDSATWVELTRQFEDSLDRINFSYPPDTDLLLSEGQNDTIHTMLQQYMAMRDRRIDEILHPVVAADTIPSDSVIVEGEVSQ